MSQIFIIGDAAPNTKSEVSSKRLPESKWAGSRFAVPTYWEDELNKLKATKIPVFAFYVEPKFKEAFDKLAINGGVSKFLDVNNQSIG